MVVPLFYEADTGAEKAALASLSESVHLFMALVAKYSWPLKMVDIEIAFLEARFGPEDSDVHVIPPTGFERFPKQANQVWGKCLGSTGFACPLVDGDEVSLVPHAIRLYAEHGGPVCLMSRTKEFYVSSMGTINV